jgi:hypothetical protein
MPIESLTSTRIKNDLVVGGSLGSRTINKSIFRNRCFVRVRHTNHLAMWETILFRTEYGSGIERESTEYSYP